MENFINQTLTTGLVVTFRSLFKEENKEDLPGLKNEIFLLNMF